MPQRIQRKRVKGWRMPEGAIYVGRPTKWGNPYCKPESAIVAPDLNWREQAVARFRCAIEEDRRYGRNVLGFHFHEIEQLREHDLCCWCPLVDEDCQPVPCHADVLLDLANT